MKTLFPFSFDLYELTNYRLNIYLTDINTRQQGATKNSNFYFEKLLLDFILLFI